MDDTEYQKEYDRAAAELEAAAQATTARGPDGKFTKAQAKEEPVIEPVKEQPKEPVKEEVKEPVKDEDPLAEIRTRLEKAEKVAKDNQAWATRLAQENARIKREQEQREREAKKPAILDANPDLADAIRYVAHDPAPAQKQEDQREQWKAAVEKAHPGIFDLSIDPELETALLARFKALGEQVNDPLLAIREITTEKLAFNERQLGKRFAAESAKLAQKNAMSVPGAGRSGVMTPVDDQLAEVQRINGLSDADFQKEVRRVKGL